MSNVLQIIVAALVAAGVAYADPPAAPVIRSSWENLPPLGCEPTKLPKGKKPKEKAVAALQEKRAKVIEALRGTRFCGLCEVVSVKSDPAGTSGFQVIVTECKSLEQAFHGPPIVLVQGRFIRRLAVWITDGQHALALTKNDRFNVVGDVDDLVIDDGQVLSEFSGKNPAVDQTFTLHLSKVTH